MLACRSLSEDMGPVTKAIVESPIWAIFSHFSLKIGELKEPWTRNWGYIAVL